MNEKDHRVVILTVRVTPDQAREIRLAARAERVTVSEFIRRSVREQADNLSAGGTR